MSAGGAARFVGQRVQRREDARLVTGHGRYVDDVVVPGMLHAAFVRSDVSRGRLLGLDVSAALAAPGVAAVYTAADLHPFMRETWHGIVGRDFGGPPARALADGDVRYTGEPIALVIADSRYRAEDAAELVAVEIEATEPLLDVDAAAENTRELVHPELGTNVAAEIPRANNAALDRSFEQAAHRFEQTWQQHRHTNSPMETRGLVAHWNPETRELEIHAATQSVHELRCFSARLLDLPEDRIHVVARDVGGGFGQKMFAMREEISVLLATWRLGKPIKWIEDRRENLIASNHARAERITVEVATDAEGWLLAMRSHHVEDVGAYPCPGNGSTAGLTGMVLPGPYRVSRFAFSGRASYTNTCGRAAYRGPWMMETVAREQMMDHVARGLGIDPLALRRRNVLQTSELPYTTSTGMIYDRISPARTLDQAAEKIGYEEFRREQAAARREGRYLGLGISLYVEPTQSMGGMLASEEARITLDSAGRVQVHMGTTSHGHSLETTMAQVVAEALGCDIDEVEITQGDTKGTPHGAGTGGSRSAVLGGGAAGLATGKLRSQVLDVAAALLDRRPDELAIEQGRVGAADGPGRTLGLRDIAAAVADRDPRIPPHIKPELAAAVRYTATAQVWSNSCHICTCEVDPRTGVVRILRYVVSEDCGNMINPMVVEGQIAGGVAQGIGGALYEHMVYDEYGNPLTSTFMDYLLPTAAEIPSFEYDHVITPSSTPGGYKGMGEGGAIGSPPALMNAINDALAPFGIELTAQPATPSRLLAALGGRVRHDA